MAMIGKGRHHHHRGIWTALCEASPDIAATSASASITSISTFAAIMTVTALDDVQADDEDKFRSDLPVPETPVADLEGFLEKGRLNATITSGGSTKVQCRQRTT